MLQVLLAPLQKGYVKKMRSDRVEISAHFQARPDFCVALFFLNKHNVYKGGIIKQIPPFGTRILISGTYK